MTGEPRSLTATPGAAAGAAGTLAAALDYLQLAGAIFLRGEYTEAWAYESPTGETMSSVLRPGRERLLYFHIVASGRCWVSLLDGERYWARQGDVVVLPYGDQHRMGGASEAPCASIMDLIAPPPWTELPVVRHGRGGDRTDIICGYLDVEDPLFSPTMRALPPIFTVSPSGAAADWVASSLAYVLEASEKGGTTSQILTRLPALLLSEVLRIHLATAPAVNHGWLAALRDPVLAPALAAIHQAPERPWTVTEMAASAYVSRSLLDSRFRKVLGRSPIRYLTDWRLHIAKDLLRSTALNVGVVASRVGYQSEESFSRAFKRAFGASPSSWRTAKAER